MSTLETTPLVQPPLMREAARELLSDSKPWNVSAVAGDILTLGAGTAFAVICNTLLVFLIPRLVSVEQYGYWRLFLLYAGYVGLLHLGFADGALLRWAGQSFEAIHGQIGSSWKYLLLEHLAIVVPVGVLVAIVPGVPSRIRVVCAAVLLFAVVMNSATLLQYSLQASRVFRPVAVAGAAPLGIFLVASFLWSLLRVPTANDLMVMYGVSWIIAVLYLAERTKPWAVRSSQSAWSLGRTLTGAGWAVVLANGAFGLAQCADRLAVSAAMPITEFAQYSLAASAMFVPVTAIAAISRVFFSHAATLDHVDRPRIYGHMSGFLLIAWSLLLPYFFVLEIFVKRFLPRYLPGLPVAAVLLLSVGFLAGIQILHMNYFYLYGRQKEFLYQTAGALGGTVGVAVLMATTMRSLLAVAIGQVVVLAMWWLWNEWSLRRTTRQTGKDWIRMGTITIWSAVSYGLVLFFVSEIAFRLVFYYGLLGMALWVCYRHEFHFGWELLRARSVEPK